MAGPTLRALACRRPVLGTFVKLPRPEVVDVLAAAGLDFLICDTEHAQIDEREARTVIQAGRSAGIPVVVRVASLDPGQLNRYLEAGADGIQLSGVTTAVEAERLNRSLRYPPAGQRGLSLAQPAARYGATPVREYLDTSNNETLGIGQLESDRYDDPLDTIMAGLDIAFVGPMDLSVDLGVPGQTQAPAVVAKIAEIEDAARTTETPLGIFAANAADARRAIGAGYRYVAVGSDLAVLAAAAKDRFAALVEEVGDGG